MSTLTQKKPPVRWQVVAAAIGLAWLLALVPAACPAQQLRPDRHSASATTRPLQIMVDTSIFQVTDSLAAASQRERLEHAGCLLGHTASDTVWVQVAVPAILYEQSDTSAAFGCPMGITVGGWHSHVPRRGYDLPPIAWCSLSAQDSTTAREWARNGMGLQVVTVTPGVRCAWWVAPDGTFVRIQ